MSFDDGPDPVWTPKLLDQLRRLRARATFFLISTRAAAHPGIVARMKAEGHTVGLHCREHIRHSGRDRAWLREDTRAALATLHAVGVAPDLWRAPWGDTAAWSARVASDHGLRFVGWTVDTHDWRGDTAAEMFASDPDRTQATARSCWPMTARAWSTTNRRRGNARLPGLGRRSCSRARAHARGAPVTATIVPGQLGIDEALTWIAATAAERDREPRPALSGGGDRAARGGGRADVQRAARHGSSAGD